MDTNNKLIVCTKKYLDNINKVYDLTKNKTQEDIYSYFYL
jgi:hypothetical protein